MVVTSESCLPHTAVQGPLAPVLAARLFHVLQPWGRQQGAPAAQPSAMLPDVTPLLRGVGQAGEVTLLEMLLLHVPK